MTARGAGRTAAGRCSRTGTAAPRTTTETAETASCSTPKRASGRTRRASRRNRTCARGRLKVNMAGEGEGDRQIRREG